MITYTGADEHTGQPRPPAVPLGELLDALDRTTRRRRSATRVAGPAPAAAVRPPQRRRPARSAPPGRSPSTRRAGRGARRRPAPGLPQPAFLAGRCRCRAGRRRRAGRPDRVLPRPGQGVPPHARRDACRGRSTASPTRCPSSSTAWRSGRVGDRMLRDRLAGIHPDARAAGGVAARRRCRPGRLGWRTGAEIRDAAIAARRSRLDRTARSAARRRSTWTSTSAAAAGCTGTVPGVYGTPAGRRSATRGSAPSSCCGAWIQLLALAAARRRTTAGPPLVDRAAAARRRPGAPRLFGPVDAEAPALLRRPGRRSTTRGRREPLPLPLKTVVRLGAGPRGPATTRSRRAERSGSRGSYDRRGRRPPPTSGSGAPTRRSRVLLGSRPGRDEERPGEPTRFGALAARGCGRRCCASSRRAP